jgi:hypothetical protein
MKHETSYKFNHELIKTVEDVVRAGCNIDFDWYLRRVHHGAGDVAYYVITAGEDEWELQGLNGVLELICSKIGWLADFVQERYIVEDPNT